MYRHWYVAHLNQLSFDESTALISSLELLENDNIAVELRECALIKIKNQFNLNLQVYSLPSLLHIALSEKLEISLLGQAIFLIQRICKMTENAIAVDLAQNIGNREKLTVLLQNYESEDFDEEVMTEVEYTELIHHVDQVMVFGILRQLTSEEIFDMIEGNSNWIGLLKRALLGRLGRYVLTLVSETISWHDIILFEESPDELMPFNCYYYSQPDLLYAWICLKTVKMRPQDCLKLQVPYPFNETVIDPFTRTGAEWLFRGRDKAIIHPEEYVDTYNHLWNFSLWLVALKRSIRKDTLVELIRKLTNIWKNRRESNSKWTPWVYRNYPEYNKQHSTPSINPEYKDMETQVGALKAALSVPLISLMVENLGDNIIDFIGDLSLNLYDVMAGPSVRSYIEYGYYRPYVTEDSIRQYSPSIISILSYAKHLTIQIGKGYLNPYIPKLYTNLIINKAVPIFLNKRNTLTKQEKYLHSGASIQACAYLAYEEATGTIPIMQSKRYWMDGGKGSLAAKICSIALNDFCFYIINNTNYKKANIKPYSIMGKLVSLAYEHFTDLISETVITHLQLRDWLDEWYKEKISIDRKSKRKREIRLNETELLLKKYSAEDWQCRPFELPSMDSKAYRYEFMALTRKLTSILQESYYLNEESYILLQKWAESIVNIYEREKFSRTSRYISIELLQSLLHTDTFAYIHALSTQSNAVILNDARDISQIILKTIVDLSRNAVFYQYAIGKVITETDDMQQNETMNTLKSIYFSMLLDQSLLKENEKHIFLSPFQEMEGKANTESKMNLLLWFIHRISPQIKQNRYLRNNLIQLLYHIKYKNPKYLPITIYTDRIEAYNTKLCDVKNWNKYWDPDTLACAKRVEQFIKVTVPTEQNGKGTVPIERGYIAFLLECIYVNEFVRVTLIEEDENGILVSTSPGCNYRLSAEFWDAKSFSELHMEIARVIDEYEIDSYGLYIDLTIKENHGLPYIWYKKIDSQNLHYRTLFRVGDSFSRQELELIKDIYTNISLDQINRHYSSDTNYFCIANSGWDIISRRSGIVKFIPDRGWKSIKRVGNESEAEVIRMLLGLHRGQHIKLKNIVPIRGNEENTQSMLAFTEHEVKLWVDSDSVALDHYALSQNVLNSYAVLTNVPNFDTNMPAPNGVIWRINYSLGKAEIKYIDCNDCVQSVQIDLSILGIRGVYNGLPMLVSDDNIQCVQIGSAKKQAKVMYARRLWSINKKPGNAKMTENQLYLGEYSLHNDDQCVYIVQDIIKGILFAYDKPTLSVPTSKCGINQESFKVYPTSAYRSDSRYIIVMCRQGNRTYYGEADPGVFPFTGAKCDSISVQLKEKLDNKSGKSFYDVRRVFAEPIPDNDETKRTKYEISSGIQNQGSRLVQRYMNDYQSWLLDPDWDFQVEGRVVKYENKMMIELRRPLQYLPVDGKKTSDNDPEKWVNRIPIVPEDLEVPQCFKNKLAYARIKWSGGIGAYPNETKEFDLDLFQKWLTLKCRNVKEYAAYPLRFLKLQEGNLMFEWGVGYRLMIESHKVIIGNKEHAKMLFFYGDEIKRYYIIRMGAALYLSIVDINDIEFSFEHRIKQFNDRRGLPFLRIVYNKKNNIISTQSITIDGDTKRLDTGRIAWSFEPYHMGFLDEKTEQVVRNRLPDGGEGYLLVKPVWDESIHKMYYSMTTVKEGDVLCLMGGGICTYSSGNDYFVPFDVPFSSEKYLGVDNIVSKIRVNRRQFSYRESILRTYYIQGNTSAFKTQMLVKIEEYDNSIHGSIKGLPLRNIDHVKEWVKKVGPQKVVFGKNDKTKNKIIVEIRPSILCSVTKGRGIPDIGSTGKLYLENDELFVDVISDSDRQFCKAGRIVELLIKSKKAIEKQDALHFTIAGLPQIQLSHQQLAEQLIHSTPPRYGILINDQTVVSCKKTPQYGYLKVIHSNDGEESKIVLFKSDRQSSEESAPFHKISFFDGSVSDIANHLMRGKWHYHDQTTWISCGGGELPYIYPQDSESPILFDKRWSLRYSELDLHRNAFPPHELEEFGVPKEQFGLHGYYPIAGKDLDGIFIELLPGRIIRLPLALIQIDFTIEANTVFHTEMLAIGDMVQLVTREIVPGKPLEISICDVRYGMRSLIKKAAYLIVKDWKLGCITLGCSAFNFKYPSCKPPIEPLPLAMCLTPQNRLIPLQKGTIPEVGDIVSVMMNEQKCLYAVGFNNMRISLSDKGTNAWRRDFWLRKALSYQQLFDAMGGSIPMRVESIDIQYDGLQISYPQPNNPEIGEVLCAQIIDRMGETCKLLLRAGTRLIVLDIADELQVPRNLAVEIIKNSIQGPLNCGKTIWLRYCGNTKESLERYKIGFDYEKNESFSVKPLIIIDHDEYGHGFLCENVRNHAWIWLPVINIARAKNATASKVMSVLREFYCKDTNSNQHDYPTFSVRVDHSTGFASWIDANEYYQKSFHGMKSKDYENPINIRIIEKLDTENDHTYLCYERPRGNIYQLRSEKIHSTTGIESFISAFCSKKSENCAELIAAKEVRTRIKLSHYLLETLRVGYVNNEHMINNRTKMKQRYNPLSDEMMVLINKCEYMERLAAQNISENDPEYISLIEDINNILRYYKEVIKENDETYDIPVCLAVASAILVSKKNLDVGQKIYQLIKNDVDLYCCEEIILRHWLLIDAMYSKYDPRRILDRLDIRGIDLNNGKVNNSYLGNLLPHQITDINQIIDTILRRNCVNLSSEIYHLTLCLKYAINRISNNDLDLAWKQCHFKLLWDCDSIEDLILSIGFEKWFYELYNDCVLCHICVQDSKQIIELLLQSLD